MVQAVLDPSSEGVNRTREGPCTMRIAALLSCHLYEPLFRMNTTKSTSLFRTSKGNEGPGPRPQGALALSADCVALNRQKLAVQRCSVVPCTCAHTSASREQQENGDWSHRGQRLAGAQRRHTVHTKV